MFLGCAAVVLLSVISFLSRAGETAFPSIPEGKLGETASEDSCSQQLFAGRIIKLSQMHCPPALSMVECLINQPQCQYALEQDRSRVSDRHSLLQRNRNCSKAAPGQIFRILLATAKNWRKDLRKSGLEKRQLCDVLIYRDLKTTKAAK